MIYSEDGFKLFHSVSEEQYEQQLAIVSQKWDAAFKHYTITMRYILMFVLLDGGCWKTCTFTTHAYSGVINNKSEGLNRVIKDLQGWKEAPVHCVKLAIYHTTTGILSQQNQAGAHRHGKVPPQIGPYASIQANHGLVDYIPTSTPEEVCRESINS